MSRILTSRTAGAARLRELLGGPDPVLAPGAYDALSARLIEQAGFTAVYMTGFGVSASLAGLPDIGLLTMTEMVEQARRIVDAVGVPVIADADTGYGNPINVLRTVRAYERAGVAAIHLEDQVAPKKCGHTEGKQVIPTGEMVEKIRAAATARRSPDFLIIARTDACAVEGLTAALERARRYRGAGADVLFVEAPQTEAEVEAVAHAFPGVPLLFNWAEGGKTPPMSLERLRALGFRLIIFPISTLLAAARAVSDVLAQIWAAGTPERALDQRIRFDEFLAFMGFPEIRELERRFGGTTAGPFTRPAT